MIRAGEASFRHFESLYPGIRCAIRRIEGAPRPLCPHCHSDDTAHVYAGLVVRALAIACLTARLHVLPHPHRATRYWCHGCGRGFGARGPVPHDWLGAPGARATAGRGLPPAAG